jgi:hypothetical protein
MYKNILITKNWTGQYWWWKLATVLLINLWNLGFYYSKFNEIKNYSIDINIYISIKEPSKWSKTYSNSKIATSSLLIKYYNWFEIIKMDWDA